MNFLLITNTDWNEVPRIRHQISFLLRDNKIKVYFFERKKDNDFSRSNIKHNKGDLIKTINLYFRIHPKLRVQYLSWVLSYLDSLRIKLFTLRNNILDDEDLYIVNFCQELFHLAHFFPKSNHSLFIHDDFVSQTNNNFLKTILNYQFKKSIGIYKNYAVFCSSSMLIKKVNKVEAVKKTSLFYPWAQKSFKGETYFSSDKNTRRSILFWGVKNDCIDWDFLKNLENEIINKGPLYKFIDRVLIVGPWARKNMFLAKQLQSLKTKEVIKDLNTTEFSELPLKSVLAGIIPFKENHNNSLLDVELSNKSFSYLEYGIPIIIKGLPNFLEKPFFPKIKTNLDLYKCLDLIKNSSELNKQIETFYYANSPSPRLKDLLSSMN